MTDAGEILVVIPARGSSKRLPRKNVLPLAGKPLICWTIEAALEADLGARILVSSDDEEILDIARQYESRGVIAHKRPAELATDTATSTDTVIEAVAVERAAGHASGITVLLQPTSPLRTSNDIREAYRIFDTGERDVTVVSVCEVDHPTAWVGVIGDNGVLDGVDISGRRSQEYPKEYRVNGAIYVGRTDLILENRSILTRKLFASIMPRARSIDIDEPVDWLICEKLIDSFN